MWLDGKSTEGYGRFSWGAQTYQAHRVSYLLEYKIDPGIMLVCHECNNPPCVNPAHLFLGTESTNRKHAFDCGRKSQVGILNSCVKLNEAQVKEIRHIWAAREMSISQIARKFAMSNGAIAGIIYRKTWRHVE